MKKIIEVIEISLIFLFIALGFIVIADNGSDTNKELIKQSKEITKLKERVKILETKNKLYEYDLDQINEYHNSEVD